MKNSRPVGKIPGTHLIKCLDVYALGHLASLPCNVEDDYTRGVRDVLRWLNGAPPTYELIDLLDLENDKENSA